MPLPLLPLFTSVAFNPWMLGAAAVSVTDFACQGTSHFIPSAADSTICQVPRNIIQGTANTILSTVKVATTVGKVLDSTSKGLDAAADTIEKGAKATGNFAGAFTTLSSRVFDLASHPYAPHICAGVAATVAGVYATMKIIGFISKHRESAYYCETLRAEARKNDAEADASQAAIARTHLEMKVIETELEKQKIDVEMKKLELKEKKLEFLSKWKTKNHENASTQTDNKDTH